MSRKQPTPTDPHYNPSLDELDKMLYVYLFTKAYNTDQFINFYHGNKYMSIEIKRGQTFFIIAEIEKQTGISRKRINKSLEKLKKSAFEMQVEKKPYGCIITWVSYDEMIKMKVESKNEGKSKVNRKQIEGKSSTYSDKSEENEKNEKNNNLDKILLSIDNTTESLEEYKEFRNGSPILEKKVRKITDSIKKERIKLRQEFTRDEIMQSTKNYGLEIRKRKKTMSPQNSFFHHRFTMYEFISQKNGLRNYINK